MVVGWLVCVCGCGCATLFSLPDYTSTSYSVISLRIECLVEVDWHEMMPSKNHKIKHVVLLRVFILVQTNKPRYFTITSSCFMPPTCYCMRAYYCACSCRSIGPFLIKLFLFSPLYTASQAQRLIRERNQAMVVPLFVSVRSSVSARVFLAVVFPPPSNLVDRSLRSMSAVISLV